MTYSTVDPPNILFLHSHNTGRYVQPYGHAVPTPHLQRLATQGVVFRNCFAASPTCSPSRASFLSGMYPHRCGMLGLAHRGFAMNDYGVHLAQTLKQAGYQTALAGVEHTASDLSQVGYDRILSRDDTNYAADPDKPAAADAAVDFLRTRQSGDRPFFLSVGLNETHLPFPSADPVRHPHEDERYCNVPMPLPDVPEIRRLFASFKASARVMDEAYGSVLQALDDAGLAESTLVCCFSDHGLQFPRNMCNLTDHGLGVYCVIRGPGGFRGGTVVEPMVSLLDLAPTVYQLAGVDPPHAIDGMSLLPLVNGQVEGLHDELFAEINYHAAYEPTRSVRTPRYRYIRRYDQRDRVVLPNADDSPAKEALLDRGWEQQPREREALFDLAFDPCETHNLIAHPDLAPTCSDLRQRLDQWMHDTADPLLLHGHVPAPSGARVTPQGARSPKENVQAID